MKKSNILICLLLLFAMLCTLPVSASEMSDRNTVEVKSAFVQDDTLYAFFDLNGNTVSSLKVDVKTANSDVPQAMKLASFEKSNLPVHYYLLVDRAGTMNDFKEEIHGFVSSLLERGVDTVTLASYGVEFASLYSGTDEEEALAVLDGIVYDEDPVNLYQGIEEALDDINDNARSRKTGELVQLVLITDGLLGKVNGEFAREEIGALLENFPEVVFHSYVLEDDDGADLNGLGRGLYLTIDDVNVSGRIHDFADELLVASHELSQSPEAGRSDMTFNIVVKGQDGGLDSTTLCGVPVLGRAGMPDISEKPTSSSSPEGSSQGETTSSNSEMPSETTSDGESSHDETSSASESEVTSGEHSGLAGAFAGIDPSTWVVIGIVVAAVVLAVIVLAVVLVLVAHGRKKRRRAAMLAGAVHLRLEVLDGRCRAVRKPLAVAGELFIGTDTVGGIVWDEPAMAPKNTRLFMQDGVLFIEDLDSPQGTALGGMRIFAPNRLRSGEIISIGNVQFKLYFGEDNSAQ